MRTDTGRGECRFGVLAQTMLAAIALLYYGLYYRAGFNLADDGSVVLLSQRLANGERPLVDLILGYNVLWFYPIAGLFRVFGVSLIVARVWFFFLHTLTAIAAFQLLFRLTRRTWFAFGVALFLILIPGTNNKAWIPLMVTANALCLAALIRSDSLRARAWNSLAGGIVLGFTLLIRVDIGLFFILIWLGVHVLSVFAFPDSRRRAAAFLAGAAIFTSAVVLIHVPVYIDASRRGFGNELLGQYGVAYRYLRYSAKMAASVPTATPSHSETAPRPAPAGALSANPPVSHGMVLANMPRKPFSDIWKAKHISRRALPFLTYAPLFSLGLILLGSLFLFALDLRAGRPEAFRDLLLSWTLAGAALTTFSQFYLFRPDVAHLSEFMPGAIIAMTAFGYRLISRFRKVYLPVLFVLALHLILYALFGVTEPGAGTIALRKDRTTLFHAENGVDVYVTPAEFDGMSKLRDIVERNSGPDDYVVCYPYSPGINFMTNRRTYEKNLYSDNAIRSLDAFNAQLIQRIEKYRPAVIVINDWAVNRTDASRFDNWGKGAKDYITAHYNPAGTFFRHEIYTREAVR